MSLWTHMFMSLLFLGFMGLFIHSYNLFQMLICYELQSMGLYIFLMFAAMTINDMNILAITVLLWAMAAAETAMGMSLLMTFKNKMNNSMHKIRS